VRDARVSATSTRVTSCQDPLSSQQAAQVEHRRVAPPSSSS